MKKRLIEQIENMNFSDIFLEDVKRSHPYTYGQFFYECSCLCEILDSESKCNSIVAILENDVLLVKMYFVALMSKRTIYVIDPQKAETEINEILEQIPQSFLIKENDVIVHRKDFFDISEETRKISSETVLSKDNIKELVLEKLKERDFDDCYLVTYTSGTTGVSKGVKHTFNNLLGTAYALQEKVQAPKRNVFLHVMPMTYMAGILNSIFYPFIAELKIVVAERFSVKTAISFWNIVELNQITVFWLSPAMLMMIEQVDRKTIGETYCNEHEMFFLIGTAALTDSMREKFEKRYKVPLYASYGLSETLFISIETKKSRSATSQNNVGELLTGVEYQIIDGEMLLNVPWMFLGYTNTDTEEYFEGVYYKSGDLVDIKDGVLFITGRKKDLIVRGGMNISPARIEKIVNADERIVECAIVGVKNKFDEEQVCCVYVPASKDIDVNAVETSTNKTIINQLGKNYRVDIFFSVNSLPRNINGKIDKEKIKVLVGEINDN